MSGHTILCLVLALAATVCGYTRARSESCDVRMRTDAGWVCGLARYADDNFEYASFRGVPYGKPPTGERRFKELERLDPWHGVYYATKESPICLQTDVLYGRIMQPQGMSEDCIYANIHVPIDALPKSEWTPATDLESPRELDSGSLEVSQHGLPILVFIHGGGFAYGSGDSDLHGPEYLVSKNVIVITFNYRLNIFGFLSLNTKQVPGNAGLRDMVTLLHWVQRNARSFGGDPDNVTLGGQSAGAISAHLLSLSKSTKGLFKRAILMSGTATSSLYSPSPIFAQYIQKLLMAILQISTTDPNEIYQQLIAVPAEKLVNANQFLLQQLGLTTFVPTVESSFPGVTPIIDDYPEILIAKGRGKDVPLLVGNTNSECECFRRRLEDFDFAQKIKDNPVIVIPPKLLFSTPAHMIPDVAKKIDGMYYNGTNTIDSFIKACTNGFFEYPVLKLVEERMKTDAEPMYVYKFSYVNDSSILKVAGLKYQGAAHIEDMTYVFKTNSMLEIRNSFPRKIDDDNMKNFMTKIFVNFMTCSRPICVSDPIWPDATGNRYLYEDIDTPYVYQLKGISREQQEIKEFYDSLNAIE